VGCWHGYLSMVRCRFAYGPADTTAAHCLLHQEIQLCEQTDRQTDFHTQYITSQPYLGEVIIWCCMLTRFLDEAGDWLVFITSLMGVVSYEQQTSNESLEHMKLIVVESWDIEKMEVSDVAVLFIPLLKTAVTKLIKFCLVSMLSVLVDQIYWLIESLISW